MLDQRRAASRPEEKREQLFTSDTKVCSRGLRLTDQHLEAAQDLVQDAFVQFMLGGRDLCPIEQTLLMLVAASCANTGSSKSARWPSRSLGRAGSRRSYLLNQAKADRNEQVTLTRSAGGSLRVEGLVEDEQRKSEKLHKLALANNEAVRTAFRISTRCSSGALKSSLTLSLELHALGN